jgi:hypothetical protein
MLCVCSKAKTAWCRNSKTNTKRCVNRNMITFPSHSTRSSLNRRQSKAKQLQGDRMTSCTVESVCILIHVPNCTVNRTALKPGYHQH